MSKNPRSGYDVAIVSQLQSTLSAESERERGGDVLLTLMVYVPCPHS